MIAIPDCKCVSFVGCKVPVSGNVNLCADIYIPRGKLNEKLPAYLTFSPYNATMSRPDGAISFAIEHGFAAVVADCRGRGNSEGCFHPWQEEFVRDAYGLLEWICAQDWSSGKVVMVGGSYPAATQFAVMRSGHKGLVACAPSAVTLDPYSIYYANGAQVLAFVSSWHLGICTPAASPSKKALPFPEAIRLPPLCETTSRMEVSSPSWQDIIRHESRDGFWEEKSSPCNLSKSPAGVFYQCSWFDMLGVDTFETFDRLLAEVSSPDTPRKYSCLRVGPWGHGVNTTEGELSYGKEAMATEEDEIDFLVSIARGEVPKTHNAPSKIKIFTMGRNKWRYIDSWPPKNTEMVPFYLENGGSISLLKPENEEGFDCYDYDPGNPVPTCGGRMVGTGGQRDQSEIEKRPDVLVYTSKKLESELEVTGRIEAELFVSTSAIDTDFTVKVVDVFEDGRPYNVCDGIIRCKWRDGLDKPPRTMIPHETTRLRFFVDITSYAFLPGHAVRLEISSSNFPHFSCNPNTGESAAEGRTRIVARQKVFHCRRYPSSVILPVAKQAKNR